MLSFIHLQRAGLATLAARLDSVLGRAEDVPVIVVGGGAALCADALPGASAVHRPEHADVANAIGAAIPQARLSTYLPP